MGKTGLPAQDGLDLKEGERRGKDGSAIGLAQLAAIVEGSDDAILTKDLNGVITSWNRGAERTFGYTADEAIGRPVTMLIPADRLNEETEILRRIRRGEHVDHYETIRQRKDGRPLHISLTVSPLRDEAGTIVGASKIARDVSEKYRAEEQQRLLLAEMQHRIKNVFAVTASLVRLCASRAKSPDEMAQMVRNRLQALAQAHALTVPSAGSEQADANPTTTLGTLLRTLVVPAVGDEDRVVFCGDDLPLSSRAVTPLALVLNELVTNAAKHGALSDEDGSIVVACRREGDRVVVTWKEESANAPVAPPEGAGFGTYLSQMTVEYQLGGTIVRDWNPSGLGITITFAADQLV